MPVIAVGEDLVTHEIIKRIITHTGKAIDSVIEAPARGGNIRNEILKYNILPSKVIALTDLDTYDCPPSLIEEWFQGVNISRNIAFRIAYDEGESWLMADRNGFAKYLKIDVGLIPKKRNIQKRKPENVELHFPYKPSAFLITQLSQNIPDNTLRDQQPKTGAKKGPAYNSAMLPFVMKHWNIDAACENSYSLRKAVERISSLLD